MNQIECHPYLNQHRLMAFCNANNIRITAYSPLGCKDRLWTSPLDDQPLLEHTTLQGIAKKHRKSIAQILLRWQVRCLTVKKYFLPGNKGKRNKSLILFLKGNKTTNFSQEKLSGTQNLDRTV